jgi:hypothetical protein
MALDRDTLNQLLGTVERFVAERLRALEERVAEEDRIPRRCASSGCSGSRSRRNTAG